MAFDKSRLFESENGFGLLGNQEAEAGLVKFGLGYGYFAPASSQKVNYLSNGNIDNIEFYRGNVQTAPNLIARFIVNYSSGRPSGETHRFFNEQGDIVEERTYSFTYTSGRITQVSEVIT